MNRNIKRLIYGTAYLAFFAVIIFGVYLLALKPEPSCFDGKMNGLEEGIDCGGPCAPCAETSLSPLSASWEKYFTFGNATMAAVEIKNGNSGYGAEYFDYKISLIDSQGNSISSISGNSFIYAGEIKHIMETMPISIDSAGVFTVKTEFSNVKWKLKEEFPKPQVETRALVGKIREMPPAIEGIASNQSAFPVSKATIFAFVYDGNFGIGIGAASKTEVENIPAFGEKPFKISFPRDINLESINPDNFKVFIEAKR